jgi:hypothetical protein
VWFQRSRCIPASGVPKCSATSRPGAAASAISSPQQSPRSPKHISPPSADLAAAVSGSSRGFRSRDVTLFGALDVAPSCAHLQSAKRECRATGAAAARHCRSNAGEDAYSASITDVGGAKLANWVRRAVKAPRSRVRNAGVGRGALMGTQGAPNFSRLCVHAGRKLARVTSGRVQLLSSLSRCSFESDPLLSSSTHEIRSATRLQEKACQLKLDTSPM